MAILTGNFMVFFSLIEEIPGNTLNLVKATKFTIHKSSPHSTLYLYNYINYVKYMCYLRYLSVLENDTGSSFTVDCKFDPQ
jgi:hypothetical protein